jgi:hypothetical protein
MNRVLSFCGWLGAMLVLAAASTPSEESLKLHLKMQREIRNLGAAVAPPPLTPRFLLPFFMGMKVSAEDCVLLRRSDTDTSQANQGHVGTVGRPGAPGGKL